MTCQKKKKRSLIELRKMRCLAHAILKRSDREQELTKINKSTNWHRVPAGASYTLRGQNTTTGSSRLAARVGRNCTGFVPKSDNLPLLLNRQDCEVGGTREAAPLDDRESGKRTSRVDRGTLCRGSWRELWREI